MKRPSVFSILMSLIFLLLGFEALAQEKVAVIVSAGDLDQLEAPMKSLEQQAMKIYGDLGYKVILVGGTANKGVNLSPEILKQTLGELRDVKDLRVDFIGHGALMPIPDAKAKGPAISMTPERKSNGNEMVSTGDGKLFWYAANSATADRQYYGRKAATFGFSPDPLKPVSHNDVKDALQKFRENNPDGVTTVNLLNCFSGAMAQELRKTPNTIVFGNSPANEPALEVADWTTTRSFLGGENDGFIRPGDGLGYYYDVLGADLKKEFSLLDARQKANFKMAGQLSQSPTAVYLVGRSPLFESALGWCEAGKPNRQSEVQPEIDNLSHMLKGEMSSIKSSFEYALAMPLASDPKRKLVDSYKEEYEKCLNPSTDDQKREQSEIDRSTPDYRAWEATRKSYAGDPARPLKMLLDRYKSILDNPKNHDRIFQNLLSSVENDLNNLRRQNLPEERWGAIKKFIEGMKNGTITKQKVVEDIRKTVEKLRTECTSKTGFPCETYWSYNQALVQYLDISPPGSRSWEAAQTCKKGPNYYECLMKNSPESLGYQLDFYWGTKALPKPQDPKDRCKNYDWLQVQRTKSNVAADEACIEDFIAHAPKDEWENLNRILTLGKRDAKGRSFTSGSSHPAGTEGVK